MVRRRAFGGVRSRAAYIKPAELFRYLEDILAAQDVDMEKQACFFVKMYKDRDKAKASNAPTSDPESWEEFKQMLPEQLKKTLGGHEFCPFVCDIETEDAEAVKEGIVVFASADSKERLMNSPNWLLEREDDTTESLFKQVRI